MKSLNGHPVFFYLAVVLTILSILIGRPAVANEATHMAADARAFSVERKLDGSASSGKKPLSVPDSKTKARTANSRHYDDYAFYVYDAFVTLFYDDDRDGHFYGLRVVFDADTDYAIADVYARLYLSYEGGPWQHYYTTDTFVLLGSSGIDDYVVETELFSGYPTGYYDVLIELYDADYGDYLTRYGPEDTFELSFLPLEDQLADQSDLGGTSPPGAVSSGGGGSLGLYSVLCLLGLWRRRLNAQA